MSYESIGSGTYRITASTGENAMELLKAQVVNVTSTLNQIISKASELIKAAKHENIDLSFGYLPRSIDVFGYRYIMALRNEVLKASQAMKDLENDHNKRGIYKVYICAKCGMRREIKNDKRYFLA